MSNRKLSINEIDVEEDMNKKTFSTLKYQNHLDAEILKEVMNTDKNVLKNLRDHMKRNEYQFSGQSKDEIAKEITAWLIDNYKFLPVMKYSSGLKSTFDMGAGIAFTIEEKNPRLLLALQKRAIVGEALSELTDTDISKTPTSRVEKFNSFINDHKDQLSKGRGTAFTEFMREIGMKIASKLGMQGLFKVHGKEFVNEVSENTKKPKPGKK